MARHDRKSPPRVDLLDRQYCTKPSWNSRYSSSSHFPCSSSTFLLFLFDHLLDHLLQHLLIPMHFLRYLSSSSQEGTFEATFFVVRLIDGSQFPKSSKRSAPRPVLRGRTRATTRRSDSKGDWNAARGEHLCTGRPVSSLHSIVGLQPPDQPCNSRQNDCNHWRRINSDRRSGQLIVANAAHGGDASVNAHNLTLHSYAGPAIRYGKTLVSDSGCIYIIWCAAMHWHENGCATAMHYGTLRYNLMRIEVGMV